MTRKATAGKGGGTQNQQKQKNSNTGGAKKESLPVRVLRAIPRGTFRTVGGALLGPPGAAIGQGISTLTGIGDYAINANGFIAGGVDTTGQLPVMDNVIGKKTVRHKEFVINIKAPTVPATFNEFSYAINPASTPLFPWLSGIAKHYQRYRIKSMVFAYETASTDYANSGTVALAVQYDPDAPEFISMGGILNSQFASASKPSASFAVPVECNKFTSNGGMLIVDEVNSRLTSFGRITVATEGLQVPAGTVIGRLHVSYEIDFTMTQAQTERLGGGGNTNYLYLNQFNQNTMSWNTDGVFSASSPGALTQFSTFSGDPLDSAEIIVSSFETNSIWAIRPRLHFKTGGRYAVAFLIHAQTSDGVTWENGLSTAGESEGDIAVTRIVSYQDYTHSVANTGGCYYVTYVVTAQPGSELVPYAGTRQHSNNGNISARLFITKLS